MSSAGHWVYDSIRLIWWKKSGFITSVCVFYPYVLFIVITVIIGRIARLNSESRYPKDDLAKLMFKLVQWFLKRFLKKVTNNTDRQQIYLLLELRLRLSGCVKPGILAKFVAIIWPLDVVNNCICWLPPVAKETGILINCCWPLPVKTMLVRA